MDMEASSELASRVTSLDSQDEFPTKMELHDSNSQAETFSSGSHRETQLFDVNDTNDTSKIKYLEPQNFNQIPIVRIKKEDVNFSNCAKGDTSQSDDDTVSQPKTETDSQEDDQESSSVPSASVVNKNIGIRIAREVKSLTIKPISNGTLPKSGKPMMSSLNRKINKPRGRPKRKDLPMYQSQVCIM